MFINFTLFLAIATGIYASSESCISQTFDATPIAGSTIGAEIKGYNLEHVTDNDFALIEHYLYQYKVIGILY